VSATVLPPQWQDAEDDDEAARLMAQEVLVCESQEWERVCDAFVYQQYASGRRLANIYGLTSGNSLSYPGTLGSMGSFDISSDNQIAIGVETLVATAGSIQPWVNITTVDGDWNQRTRARRKGDFFYGLFKETGFYNELPNIFRDMLVNGWGVGKIIVLKEGNKKRISTERCLPSEVLWNRAYSLLPGEGPTYHRRFVLRERLAREFPEFEDEIMNAPGAISGQLPGISVDMPATFVSLMEGWAPGNGDAAGRHVLSVGNACINRGKTKMAPEEDHPFYFLKGYSVGPGWQYQGVVEQTLADQLKLNKQNAIIWANQQRGASNKWLVEERSEVATNSLANLSGIVVKYRGKEPRLAVWQYNPPELYQDRDNTRKRILERLGVNQFAAQGQKPAGLNSGEAIREYGDHAAPRHTTLTRAVEECVIYATKKLAAVCERVKPTVKAPGKRSVSKLKWEDVSLPDGSYAVELAFAISTLPRTPEGITDRANELLQMGLVDAKTYARLTQTPDITAALNPLLALQDAIESILDRITEDGDYVAPDDGLDLQAAFEMATARYNRCVADRAPQDILDLLTTFRDEVKALQAPPPSPPPPPMAGPPPGPQTIAQPDAIPGPVPTGFPAPPPGVQ
jgi:hypothetical protein